MAEKTWLKLISKMNDNYEIIDDFLTSEQADFLETKYGPADRYYEEDFASGGIARLLGE